MTQEIHPTEDFDLVVIGGGLIGAAFALNIVRTTSLKVALVERGAPIEIKTPEQGAEHSNQRVIALGSHATQILSELDVFHRLPDFQAHAYQSMMIWDEGSVGELQFDASDIDEPQLGHMIDAIACTSALQQQALNSSSSGLQCYFTTQVDGLQLSQDGGLVKCADRTLSARLIVGADGPGSWVRSQAKIFANRQDYGQQGIVAKIKTSKTHGDCAWQRFLNSGPVAALPLADNFSSIVWSAEDSLAEELMQLSDADFKTVLGQAFDWRLGEVIELGDRLSFPLASQRAENYYAPSLALIGDAAHSIHPLAGQGANLGFKDVSCLTDLLAQAAPEHIGKLALLAQYEQRRRPDNEQVDILMTTLNTAYKFEQPFWLSMRGMGMNWINDSARIKTLLARHATGG